MDEKICTLCCLHKAFTPKKGFVKIHARLLNAPSSLYQLNNEIQLEIVVEDSGVGIPEDQFEVIFEHFSRFILMDVGLPCIDGIETTKQIRNLPNCKSANIPILAFTGHANDPD